MLVSLAIRNVVLIDQLDLSLSTGLGVLTGETGAGKSILLDALGLALGARAEAGLLRRGAQQASVTAAFELPAAHPVWPLLEEQGLTVEEDLLVLRRLLSADGRSRAFVNDQLVSVGLLRSLGSQLVEVQGQFAQHGLLDSSSHRELLDRYGSLNERVHQVSEAWRKWSEAEAEHARARARFEAAGRDEAFLRHALEELDSLDPQADEEEELGQERALLMNAERLSEALAVAAEALSGEAGESAERALSQALRALQRVSEQAGQRLDPLLAALDRATAEIAEADAQLASLSADLEVEPGRLALVEERYFALKELARKHGCEVKELPSLRQAFAERLAAVESGEDRLQHLRKAAEAARRAYLDEAQALGRQRRAAAMGLEEAVQLELPPLHLEKARFSCRIEPLAEPEWGALGTDRVIFEVATNPGAPGGPLSK